MEFPRSGPENENILPLDCIQCQTVLAKNLGPFSTWDDKLKISIESGYNFLHFTPIQVRKSLLTIMELAS